MRPLVRILPFQDLLLASDPDLPGEKPADFVTGVNPAAWTLAQLTIRRPAATTLDLGTGSGIQALLAARHSGRVTATDVNPRALEYLRLNARLNGVENVEPVEGSWLEPVRGRRFDLIVANPPYVISPEAAHVFKDSGLDADGASRLVVEQLPEHLEEGGVAQVLCNWVHAADEDWRAPLERWVRGRGVDALLLRYETFTPLEYATAWNASLGTDPEAFGAALDRWLAYDARLGIERIAWGHVVLRRRTGRNRVRAVEVPGGPSDGAGRQLERMLAAWDEPLGVDALPAAILRPVEGAELVRRSLASRDGGWTAGRARVTLAPTLGFAVPLDDDAAAVLAACDGATTVAGAIARVGATAGAVLPALQRLHRLGCVERVGKSGAPRRRPGDEGDHRRRPEGRAMSEHEQRPDEPEPEAEETIRDLDVPGDDADAIRGGRPDKERDIYLK